MRHRVQEKAIAHAFLLVNRWFLSSRLSTTSGTIRTETEQKATTDESDDEVTLREYFFFFCLDVVHFICRTGRTYHTPHGVCVHWNYYCKCRGEILTPFPSLSCQFAYWKCNNFSDFVSLLEICCHRRRSTVVVAAICQFRFGVVGENLTCFAHRCCLFYFLKHIARTMWRIKDEEKWQKLAEESFKRHTYKFVY